MRRALIPAAIFAVAAIALLGALPLWLDEILQLLETRDGTTSEMIARLPRNSGAAPLGYLAQRASLKLTGFSARNARIPAVIFGILSVLAVALLARELELRRVWLATLMFAAFPQTLRYAAEARVYSQALFFSILASVLYLRFVKNPSWTRALMFTLALIAAVYTQPYTIFIGVALVLWSILNRDRAVISRAAVAIALSGAAFWPWYLWSKSSWQAGIAEQNFQFALNGKMLLMIFREAAGAGYWGSGLLAILCAVAIFAPRDGSRRRSLLALLIAIPILGAIDADAATGYFIAVRQFLWTLPAVAILAAMALEPIAPFNRPSLARPILSTLTVALVAICIRQSVMFYRAPHENWQAAADSIAELATKPTDLAQNPHDLARRPSPCLEVAPAPSLRYYEFFRPELANVACSQTTATRVILAITPVTTPSQRADAIARLASLGYRQESETRVGLSTIVVFGR